MKISCVFDSPGPAGRVRGIFRVLVLAIVAAVFSCRSNPFGSTNKSIEEFSIYTSDFSTQTDGGAKAALLEVINGAKATLNCAFSALTLTDVRSALIAKATSGIQVKIAFDSDVKTSDAGSVALQASGAFTVVTTPNDSAQSQLLYGNNGTGTLRHNFCLADERYIYVSTAAPDDAQMRKTPAVSLKIGSPQFGIARDFLRELNMFSQLLFGSGKAKTDFTTKFTALDQVIGAYWGPQETPMDILGTELSEATKSVDFYSTAFQATNTTSTKSFLDVPTVLKSLETGKGLTVKKYFSSQALFDSASKAYTLNNPSQYVNTSVTTGANIFVMDRGLSSAKTFIYTGSLRSQANSSDDSVLIELRGKYVAEIVGAYLDKIGAVSIPVSNVGDVTGAVVINEIHWMGSYSNALSSDSNDEFVELFNTGSSAVNISGWKFICTSDGATSNTTIQMPAGALIAAGGFFVIANKSTGAFGNANHFDSAISITNSSVDCRLGNGTAVTVYGVTNFGALIDSAGAGAGNPFDTFPAMGTNDTTNKIRRSMERINPLASGANTTNWRANLFTSTQNTGVAAGFRDQTFASIGAVNSTPPAAPTVTNVVVNSTSPNNGTTPYNTGSTTVTLTGTNFLTVACPSGVKLNDPAATVVSACSVVSDTQISATIPSGVRLNSTTGWDVQVTNPGGTNATSSVKFIPVNGLLINEVIFNDAGTAANDAVEIHNLTGATVDLAAQGIRLQRDSSCDLSNGVTDNLTLTGTVAANGYYVITPAGSSFAGSAQQTNMTSFAPGDCLALSISTVVTAPSTVVYDFVALGNTSTLAYRENSSYAPASSPSTAAGGISRCANATDTNVNATDFLFRGTTGYSLGAANSCANDPRGLKINEIAWNTTSAADDMIEIYNPTGSAVNLALAGVFLQRDSSCTISGGAAHTEALALTGTIPANGYYTIAGLAAPSYAGSAAQTLSGTGLTTNHCILIAQGPQYATASNNLFVIDFVAWGTVTDNEGGSVAPGGTTTPNYIKRCANGADTNMNGTDFVQGGGAISQGAANNCP